jgi:hypothetical protein
MTNTDTPPDVTQEAIISGYQNGKCMVETTTVLAGESLKTQCAYSNETLQFLSDKQLKKPIQGDETEAHARMAMECTQE